MHKTGPYSLVLLRHGESEWNRDNLFTGWTDVDLTTKGIAEAEAAGKILRENKYSFDLAFTSVLTRAVQTLDIVLLEMRLSWIQVEKHWRLNERHYGALQGLNKEEMAKREGIEKVFLWRRSYDTRPPALEQDDERFPGKDLRYQNIPPADLPHSESLKNTVERFLPYWQVRIAPAMIKGRKVLIVAHGNSLRALIKYLDKIPDNEIPKLNIPTGVPLIYRLDAALKPIEHFYLGDQDAVKEAEENATDLIRRIEKNV